MCWRLGRALSAVRIENAAATGGNDENAGVEVIFRRPIFSDNCRAARRHGPSSSATSWRLARIEPESVCVADCRAPRVGVPASACSSKMRRPARNIGARNGWYARGSGCLRDRKKVAAGGRQHPVNSSSSKIYCAAMWRRIAQISFARVTHDFFVHVASDARGRR